MKNTAVTVLLVGMALCFSAVAASAPPSHANKPPAPPGQVKKNPPPVPLPPPSNTSPTLREVRTALIAVAGATSIITQRIPVLATGTRKVVVIQMTATITRVASLSLRPPGRLGDLEIVNWRFNDRFGRRIGIGDLACRWTSDTRRLCAGEIRLPRGKITVMGSSQTRDLGEMVVTGGTGTYAFKMGFLSFRAISLRKFVIKVQMV